MRQETMRLGESKQPHTAPYQHWLKVSKGLAKGADTCIIVSFGNLYHKVHPIVVS